MKNFMYPLSILALIACATPVPVVQAALPHPPFTRCNLVRPSKPEIPDKTGLAAAQPATGLDTAPSTSGIAPEPVEQPAQASLQTQASQQSSGTYVTYKFSQRLATESYKVTPRPDGTTAAEAEIEVAGQPRVKTSTLVSSFRPTSFSEETGGTKLFSADYGPDSMKIQVPGKPDVIAKAGASVVLENLVWHHYILLLSQYEGSKRGRQDFVASLPSQARILTISIDQKDSSAFDVGGRAIKTDHYILTSGAGLQVEIWADAARIPLLILIESQGLKVIHQGYEGLAEAIFAGREGVAEQPAGPFVTEDVSFKSGDITLAGTLAIPKDKVGRHPAVVMISGSGPQDRDGNPGGFFIFKLIAEQLASRGVAVLRHDDRGVGKSSMPTRPVTYQDLIDDTKAAVAYLRGRPDIDPDKIALAGHSEGGFTASIIAASDPKIAAIALLAGGALANFEDLLNEQVLYDLALQRQVDPSDHSLEQPIVQMLRRQIGEARAGLPDLKMTDGHEYFRQHLALNMTEIYNRVHCPVLILQGERDMNVLAQHAIQVALKFAALDNKNVRVRIIPNVDHGFVPSGMDKCVTEEQRSRVSQDFLNSLERWMTTVLIAKKN
jgi:pimeloyl-ACP methyl ester carboxylesterase